mmetsp:Transcript_46284/g.106845  ORF Transcript_46284/g.106845 Transcript_46284/m.106845 type:complete len:217 (+) Transcript_46284:260-910(+)
MLPPPSHSVQWVCDRLRCEPRDCTNKEVPGVQVDRSALSNKPEEIPRSRCVMIYLRRLTHAPQKHRCQQIVHGSGDKHKRNRCEKTQSKTLVETAHPMLGTSVAHELEGTPEASRRGRVRSEARVRHIERVGHEQSGRSGSINEPAPTNVCAETLILSVTSGHGPHLRCSEGAQSHDPAEASGSNMHAGTAPEGREPLQPGDVAQLVPCSSEGAQP